MEISNAVKLYKEFAKFTQTSSAAISRCCSNEGPVIVNTVQSQRDLERAEKVSFSKTYCVDVQQDKPCRVVYRSSPQELNNEIWNKESQSGQYRAIVRKVTDKKKEDKQYLEIWTGNNKIENIDLSASEKHGKVYDADGYFGCLEWSANEDKLLYVAEKKYKKAVSYFAKQSEDKEGEDKTVHGEEFMYKEDWGEGLVGKHLSVLCVLTVSTGEISIIEGIPENVCVGQVKWLPGGDSVVFTGWQHEPYRLGLIYCPMRKSTIFHLDLKSGVCQSLTSDSMSSNNGRISPDGSKLVYLQTQSSGPHMQCAELLMYDLKTKETTTVVERVGSAKDGKFPGIYNVCLPETCYSSDSKYVVVNTLWNSQNTIIAVNLETKSITRLPADNECCMVLLCIDKDMIVAECSSPSRPHYLVIGKFSSNGQVANVEWSSLDEKSPVLDSVQWKIVPHQPSPDRINPEYPNLTYESILVYPTNIGKNTPKSLVVFPHGGPHSVFTSSYMLYIALFCKLGFSSLMVNYRGSVGFGSDSIYSLPGKCGDQDVKDVQSAAMEVLEKEGYDKERMLVWGGSHGGFLTCHLVGQYPGVYKASVCRNPVINIANHKKCLVKQISNMYESYEVPKLVYLISLTPMCGSSDIPDWTNVEAGQSFNHSTIPDEQRLSAMWKCSPLQYVDQITTPMMIMIGLDDKRVPPKQSYELYKALKARNKDVRYIAYPDNGHPIVKVDSEADAFINIYKWFTEHLPAVK